jgi:hypothetical protein
MSSADRFRSIFGWLMGFVALVWIWAVALILSWPAEKNPKWEDGYRLAATCADNQGCSLLYGKIAESKANGKIKSLTPPEPFGEVQDPDAWLRWKTFSDKPYQYEAMLSSWHFEQTIRYRIENDTPILVEVRSYDVGVLNYAIPLAFVTILGLFLRNLRG